MNIEGGGEANVRGTMPRLTGQARFSEKTGQYQTGQEGVGYVPSWGRWILPVVVRFDDSTDRRRDTRSKPQCKVEVSSS